MGRHGAPAAPDRRGRCVLGLEFPPRVLKLARARVGRVFERKVLLEAGLYGPEEARRIGLVDELADDAVATGQSRLTTLAQHPRAAYAATKRALNIGTLELDFASEEAWTNEILPRWASEETKKSILRALTR